jgi:hypothetical protein
MNLDPKNPVRAVAARDYTLANCAELVTVDEARIKDLAMPADLQSMGSVLQDSVLKNSVRSYVPYFIAMNTMNYQFWDVDGQGRFTRYGHNGLVGALAMQKSFHDAWVAEGDFAQSKLSPSDNAMHAARGLLRKLQADGLHSVFGAIPDPANEQIPSRLEILSEVLDPDRLKMAASYLGDRVYVDQQLGWADAQVLATLFPKAYADDYLKKAQLTLMFIAAEWNAGVRGTSGKAIELNVTAAADYQLPKVLRSLGILHYGADLAQRVDSEVLIEEDSLEEVGIRAATIYACDKLAEHFGCTIEEVDFWLWANRNAARDAKFHLTKTTNY